jgi:hypothetical protein
VKLKGTFRVDSALAEFVANAANAITADDRINLERMVRIGEPSDFLCSQ